MNLIECFTKAGFTKHESSLYLSLCREGELTGYEAAKISGISRSNAYLALSGLVEKGGAFRIEGKSVSYIPVPVKELTGNLRREINKAFEFIENNIPEKETVTDPFVTIKGKNHIINKMKNIIIDASERIYISASADDIDHVKIEIEQAIGKGRKVVIITSRKFVLHGADIYYNEKRPGQIRLIADSAHVLTGEIDGESNAASLYSMNSNLVQLIKDSLTNEMELIKLRGNK